MTAAQIYTLGAGEKVRYGSRTFIVMGQGRTRPQIFDLANKREYSINGLVTVETLGVDNDALAEAITTRNERLAANAATLSAGTKVRFVDGEYNRKKGLVGRESVILRVNAKTYSLADGSRVSPSLVEAV